MSQVGQKKSMILSQKQFLYFEKTFYGKNLRYLINSAIGLLEILTLWLSDGTQESHLV